MTSDNRITTIIGQLSELRKLLLVIDQSGDSAPAILLKLAQEKAEGVVTSINQLRQPEFWEAVKQPAFDEWPEETDRIEEAVESVEQSPEEDWAKEPVPVEVVPDEIEGVSDEDENIQPAQIDEEEADEEEFEFDEFDEPFGEEEVVFREDKGCTFGTTPLPETVTLADVLQRKQAKELRRAFNVNDRIRYRRELFGNSDSVFNDALVLVDKMQTYEETETYFYRELGWNRENPEVIEFMKIVQNHFL